ncbi:hypothetical protein L1887_58097 [Cichorium endivia]|nr:hypothetical protein L1887_58097 [Cichorium endivia]
MDVGSASHTADDERGRLTATGVGLCAPLLQCSRQLQTRRCTVRGASVSASIRLRCAAPKSDFCSAQCCSLKTALSGIPMNPSFSFSFTSDPSLPRCAVSLLWKAKESTSCIARPNRDTLESLVKALELGRASPDNLIQDRKSSLHGSSALQIVQLAGNDVDELVDAARKVAPFADAIDLNLGCPQRHAEQGKYGAYLLPKQNWPLLSQIVSALVQAVDVPITTKIRLTVPKEQTPELAVTLARAGSSLVTLHPRFASSVRRRKGLADLDQVIQVRQALLNEGLLRCTHQPDGQTAVLLPPSTTPTLPSAPLHSRHHHPPVFVPLPSACLNTSSLPSLLAFAKEVLAFQARFCMGNWSPEHDRF